MFKLVDTTTLKARTADMREHEPILSRFIQRCPKKIPTENQICPAIEKYDDDHDGRLSKGLTGKEKHMWALTEAMAIVKLWSKMRRIWRKDIFNMAKGEPKHVSRCAATERMKKLFEKSDLDCCWIKF